MNAPRLSDRRIAMLATDGFEYSELTEPKRLLEQEGAEVQVIAPGDAADIRGWSEGDWGGKVHVDQSVEAVHIDDLDALVLPGGVMNPDKLRLHPEVIDLIRRFGETGKPLAAICHGPWTLIDAGLVEGKRVTSWPSLRKDLENAGALWEDSEVVRDGQLITSRKPNDIPAFASTLIEVLAMA